MEPPPTPSGRPPPPAGPGRPGTAALSLLQGASGLAFAAFAAAHFAGHLCVPFARSIADADAAVAMLRCAGPPHPLLEPALVPLALSVHVGAGAALASRRWPADKIAPDGGPQPSARAIDAWSRERQRASGWLLALLVPFHAAGSRGVALALFDDPKRMGYVYPLSYMSRLPALLLPAFSSVFLLLAFPGAYHLSHGRRRGRQGC
ncbi:hypothetical protein DFJ74DRAFT_774859 [Hyaloraphidium curvatum]|nr:hypothetical protein DFJ74DRAFT_774859 [Hyaloraphidium curvatum]